MNDLAVVCVVGLQGQEETMKVSCHIISPIFVL